MKTTDDPTRRQPVRWINRCMWRLVRLALLLYPTQARATHGEELWQVARDVAEDARASGSSARVVVVWMETLGDLLGAAIGERIESMRPTALLAAALTGVAFVVSLAATLNLYLLEDQNPLTLAAYRASPLLRVSYDGAYVSALAAGVLLLALVARLIAPTGLGPLVVVGALAMLGALAGFGGLLVRAPVSFALLFGGFVLLTALGVLVAERFAARLRQTLPDRSAALIGGCAGVVVALVANAATLAPHTLALNPVSHALYMQGQIPGSHLNALLLGAGLQVALVGALALSLLLAMRGSFRGSADA